MELVTVKISDLVPDPENPRSHPAENVEAIAKSLERFGQVLPLLVRDSDCRVVAGNGTLEAMKRLGWTEAKAALYDGTDVECRSLGLALNRTGDLSRFDYEILGKVISDLQSAGEPVVGFDSAELDMILSAEWRPPALEPLAEAAGTGAGPDPQGLVLNVRPEHADDVVQALGREMDAGAADESEALWRLCRGSSPGIQPTA